MERTAFDLLAGTWKQRNKTSDQALADMYQNGPRTGFANDREMLKKEFGGLCAYCGKPSGNIFEREHILPRSRFFFDSYINIVPACPPCNSNLKGKTLPGTAGLIIHEDAYEAYSKYLSTKYKDKARHRFHDIKKGILNLMRQPDRVWEAEEYLALIAKDFSGIVQSQRGPRPLARFLCGKLQVREGLVPDVVFHSGRHTEVWRRAAFPEFDKSSDKSERGVVNHAIDAILMACKLPSVSALEAKHLRSKDLNSWKQAVRDRIPLSQENDIPQLPSTVSAVSGFEELLPGNYISTDLGKFNWNRRDASIQREGIYRPSLRGTIPVMRKPAPDVVAMFKEIDKEKKTPEKRRKKIQEKIEAICHPNIRQSLLIVLELSETNEHLGEKVSKALILWLQDSIKNSLPGTGFSNHPASKMRAESLRNFAEGKNDNVPIVVGVTMLHPDIARNCDLGRVKAGSDQRIHRYVADPANRAKIVAYRPKNGKVDRSRPLTLDLRQGGAILPGTKALGEVPTGPLHGQDLGQQTNGQEKVWAIALHSYLSAANVTEYAVVTQGCVLQYGDGSEQYIRNFSPSYGFKNSLLGNIVGIRRSPLSNNVVANSRII